MQIKHTLSLLMSSTIIVALALPIVSYAQTDAEAQQDQPTTAQIDKRTSTQGILSLAPRTGYFVPSSAKTKDRFGDSWGLLTLDVKLGLSKDIDNRNQLYLGTENIYVARKNNNGHLYSIPVGVRFTHRLSDDASAAYIGFGAAQYFVDIESKQDNINANWHNTFGGNVFIGKRIGRNGFVQANYDIIRDIEGFNVSGLNISTGIGF